MVYMISYDLNHPTNNREKVMDDIKSLGAWCKYLTTTFLVSSTHDLSYIEKTVTKHLDNNDRMIICKVEKPISGWLSQYEWDWIGNNI